MKQLLFLCLFLSQIAEGQTAKTLAQMRALTSTSATTVYRVGGNLYKAEPTDKWSFDDGMSVIVNKKGLRYYLQVPFQSVPPRPEEKPVNEGAKKISLSDKQLLEINSLGDAGFSDQTKWGIRTKDTAFNMQVSFCPSMWEGAYDTYTLREQDGNGITLYLENTKGFTVSRGLAMTAVGNIRHNYGLYLFDQGLRSNVKEVFGEGSELVTFGVDGARVYIKRGGIVRYEYFAHDWMTSGHLLARGAQFKDISISLSFAKETSVVDAEKDLGFRPGCSIGSIAKGGNVIQMQSAAHGIKPGDLLYLPITQQIWPDAGYPTLEALQKANPASGLSWVHADGKVRQKYGEGWFTKDHDKDPFIRYPVRGGMRCRVLSVVGALVTVDTKANEVGVGMEVWFDNEERYNQLFGTAPAKGSLPFTLTWPTKKFGMMEAVNFRSRDNCTQIFNGTTFYAPKGAPCAYMLVSNCDNYKQPRGLTLEGPVDATGYSWGLRWWNRNPNDPNNQGGFVLSHCSNADVEVDFLNNGRGGLKPANCKGGRGAGYFKTVGPNLAYVDPAWVNNTTDDTEDFVMSGSVEGPQILNGFEAFGGANNTFKNITGINAIGSSNSSIAMDVDGWVLRFTKDAKPGWMSNGEPVWNFNKNTGRLGEFGGGKLRNGECIFLAPITPGGDFRLMANVQDDVDGVLIENNYVEWPEGAEGGETGTRAIHSTGKNVTVRNVRTKGGNAGERAWGNGNEWQAFQNANISVAHGTVENCETGSIAVKSGKVINCPNTKYIFLGPKATAEGCGNAKIIRVPWD